MPTIENMVISNQGKFREKRQPFLTYDTLDVGSGDRPLREADVLCDKHLYNNRQRGDRSLVIDGRSFVLADVEALPFRDKAFNFVYCNRVVEYTKNPEKAIGELERVGRSGYVCTPSLVFPNWYGAYSNKGKITFVPFLKSKKRRHTIRARKKFFVHSFLRLISFVTGIYTTEIYWGRGIETFTKYCKSNNKELGPFPLFLVKFLVINRKRMQDLRDEIIKQGNSIR